MSYLPVALTAIKSIENVIVGKCVRKLQFSSFWWDR